MASKQSQWSANWKRKNYERFMLEFTKGTKDKVSEYVQSQGLTMRSYILGLIEKDTGFDMHIYKGQEKEAQ